MRCVRFGAPRRRSCEGAELHQGAEIAVEDDHPALRRRGAPGRSPERRGAAMSPRSRSRVRGATCARGEVGHVGTPTAVAAAAAIARSTPLGWPFSSSPRPTSNRRRAAPLAAQTEVLRDDKWVRRSGPSMIAWGRRIVCISRGEQKRRPSSGATRAARGPARARGARSGKTSARARSMETPRKRVHRA